MKEAVDKGKTTEDQTDRRYKNNAQEGKTQTDREKREI